jgi:hypothetical protein
MKDDQDCIMLFLSPRGSDGRIQVGQVASRHTLKVRGNAQTMIRSMSSSYHVLMGKILTHSLNIKHGMKLQCLQLLFTCNPIAAAVSFKASKSWGTSSSISLGDTFIPDSPSRVRYRFRRCKSRKSTICTLSSPRRPSQPVSAASVTAA